MSNDSISSVEIKISLSTLIIYNSSGVALKTLYGVLKNGDLIMAVRTLYITIVAI